MRYIGVDLHKANFVVCFLAQQGKPRLLTFSLDAEGQAAFARHLRSEDEVAVEVGQNAYFFYEQICSKVKRVVWVDAHRFALISRSKKKTDRQDATLLARFLKMGWLPTVSEPDKRIRQLGQLFHARESLVERTTKRKNMGHGALTRNGLARGHQAFRSEKSRKQMCTLSGLAPADEHIVQGVLRQLGFLEQEVSVIEAVLVDLGRDLPGLQRMLQLPGISLLGGIALLAEIGDSHGFEKAKQLTAYAGLGTSVHQSGEHERHGKITKHGRKRLRGIMIRAALTIARVPGAGPLRDFYLRKKREKGAGKALCAVARKLLTIVFVMLKKELDYWYVEARLYNRKLQVLQAA
jgi:transposase